MKNTIFAVIAVLLCTGCSNVKKPTTLQRKGIKGKVKSILSYCYSAEQRFGKIEKGGLVDDFPYWLNIPTASLMEFNENGYKQRETSYNQNGEIDKVATYEYIGNIISSMCLYDQYSDTIYAYQNKIKNGEIVEHKVYSHYDNTFGITHEFEIQDGLIVTDKKYKKGKISSITYNTFNNGYIVEAKDMNANGVELSKYSFSRDKLGRELSIEYWNSENNDNNFQMINTFNNEGWIVTQNIKDGKDVEEYSYEYIEKDKKGNWISRLIYQNGKPKAIEERTIEYY